MSNKSVKCSWHGAKWGIRFTNQIKASIWTVPKKHVIAVLLELILLKTIPLYMWQRWLYSMLICHSFTWNVPRLKCLSLVGATAQYAPSPFTFPFRCHGNLTAIQLVTRMDAYRTWCFLPPLLLSSSLFRHPWQKHAECTLCTHATMKHSHILFKISR